MDHQTDRQMEQIIANRLSRRISTKMSTVICCNTIIFTTLFTASYLGFGIANAYVSSQNTGAKNECGAAIWHCNVMLSVIDFLSFIGMLIYLCCSINKSEKKSDSSCISSIIVLGINIWACVAYFGINSDCKSFYLTNYPQVWQMLEANVIYLFTSLGLLIIWYVSTILLVLCAHKKDDMIV